MKHVSSPIGKIITVKDVFKKLIPGEGFIEADYVQKVMIYALIKLGKRGADFYIDYQYIEAFSAEQVQHKIQEYSFIIYMQSALLGLKEGL